MTKESNVDKSVEAAISFLQNPKLAKHSNEEKRRFLKSKGFSNDDIIRAFEDNSHDFVLETTREETKFHSTQKHQWSINSLFDNITSLIAVGGVLYAAYVFIEQYFSHIKPKDSKSIKSSSVESITNNQQLNQQDMINKSVDIICKLQNRMNDVSNKVQSMNENINKLDVIPKKINEMHNEINEIRSLLVNKHQFPKAPEIFPIWQKPGEPLKTTIETQTSNSLKNGTKNLEEIIDDKEQTITEIENSFNDSTNDY